MNDLGLVASRFGRRSERASRTLVHLWFVAALASVSFFSLTRSAQAAAPRGLRFEPNVGQFESPVRYLARARDYVLFLTPEGATLELQRGRGATNGLASRGQRAVVGMKIRGARAVEPRALLALPGPSNYFVGADPARWRSAVGAYERVHYDSPLPGIDVEYYGAEAGELEYDFTIAPGSSAREVVLDFDGVSSIDLGDAGSARLHLSDGSVLIKRAPVAYQLLAGRRYPVAVEYRLRAGGLGFAVAAYDPSLPLIIDPVLSYATYFGGSSFDEATAVAADSAGNTYLVGYTASTLFPTSSPEQGPHAGGSYDAFVVKLGPGGQNLIYSTFLGGKGPDIAYAVATDAVGNAYVAGLTQSNDFPVVSAVQPAAGGGQDGFITELNASGSALAYSSYLGGALDDYVKGVAVSGAGAAYLVGTTFSTNFPTRAALQTSRRGDYDAFVTQLAPGGSSFVYSTYLGGGGTEFGNAIALDNNGSAYVVGATTSNDFPTLNARQAAHAGGNSDAFVSKLNFTGAGFVFSTYLGGSGSDEASGVSLALGTAFVVGSTLSSNFPLAFAAQDAPGGSNHSDAFVTRFDPSGTSFVYSTYLGGTGDDAAAVASDGFGNAYVVGRTDSSDLPLTSPIAGQETYRGGVDAFVATLTPTGSRFVYSSYLGGSAEDRAVGVALSPGKSHIAGITRSANFPISNPIINGLVGAQDAFVVKLPTIDAVTAPALGGSALVLVLVAALLLAIAYWQISVRRAADCRNER